jgi:hypothetical protein
MTEQEKKLSSAFVCKDKGPTLETHDAEPAAWFKARKPELKARFDKMLKSLEEKGFVDKDILPVLKALEQQSPGKMTIFSSEQITSAGPGGALVVSLLRALMRAMVQALPERQRAPSAEAAGGARS